MSFMKNNFLKISLLIAGLVCIGAVYCIRHSNKMNSYIGQIMQEYQARQILFPYIDTTPFERTFLEAPIKIVFFVDAECNTCLLQIDFFFNFVTEFNRLGYSVPILLYARSSDEHSFISYIYSSWPESEGCFWIYDADLEFIRVNELRHFVLQTLLLDSNNQILLMGNPQFNDELKKLYKKTILKYLKKN